MPIPPQLRQVVVQGIKQGRFTPQEARDAFPPGTLDFRRRQFDRRQAVGQRRSGNDRRVL